MLKILKEKLHYVLLKLDFDFFDDIIAFYLSMIVKFKEKMENKKLQKSKKCKLIIDVSSTFATSLTNKTGVYRVVDGIINNLDLVHCDCVYNYNTKCMIEINWQDKQSLNTEIDFNDTKIFFLLDPDRNYYNEYSRLLKTLQNRKIKIVGFVHDLIVLRHPVYCGSVISKFLFKKHIFLLLEYCDYIICNSKSTELDLKNFYIENRDSIKRNKDPKITFVHMGSNINCLLKNKHDTIRDELEEFCDKRTFLMVGTVEIRKGHYEVLSAFLKLWKNGYNFKLLILGKEGWQVKKFKDLYKNNNFVEKVLWIDDTNDLELKYAYKNTYALIMASKAEGYGLPLVEAANYNLKILCSKIPIFIEILKENAIYFDQNNINDIYDKILLSLMTDNSKKIHKSKFYTWKDTAKEIEDIINEIKL